MTYQAKPTLALGASALALAAILTAPARADPDQEAEIEARLDQYEARFNNQDAAAVSHLFAEDVVYYGPLGQVFEGRGAVEQRYRQSFEAGFRDMKVETLAVEVLGDTAWDIARYTITDPQGEPLQGYHLAILEKQDGEWIVQRTLVNAVMPQPAPQ
jgi:uncharacterized protein (TIGR02246 family)